MSTPAQAAASIANSKLSTGPSSVTGKQTVSANALDHGLASSKPAHVALPGEEELFANHLESYRKAYAPPTNPKRTSSAPSPNPTGGSNAPTSWKTPSSARS